MLNNKSILITGGTGSFGKAFISHILKKYKKVKHKIRAGETFDSNF